MKLSKDTLSILKNFSGINGNITIKPGNNLVTMSAGKNIVASAVVEESFPVEFGIYDLSEFLGVLSLFESPELEFHDKYVNIREGKNGIKYFAADKSILTDVPNLKQFPEPDVEFSLPGSMLSQIQRAASILRVEDFSVVGDGSAMTVAVGDKKNPSGNTYDSEVGVTDKEFKVNLRVENLKMVAGDYHISIGNKKMARFQSTNSQLVYYVAIEVDSSFGF